MPMGSEWILLQHVSEVANACSCAHTNTTLARTKSNLQGQGLRAGRFAISKFHLCSVLARFKYDVRGAMLSEIRPSSLNLL